MVPVSPPHLHAPLSRSKASCSWVVIRRAWIVLSAPSVVRHNKLAPLVASAWKKSPTSRLRSAIFRSTADSNHQISLNASRMRTEHRARKAHFRRTPRAKVKNCEQMHGLELAGRRPCPKRLGLFRSDGVWEGHHYGVSHRDLVCPQLLVSPGWLWLGKPTLAACGTRWTAGEPARLRRACCLLRTLSRRDLHQLVTKQSHSVFIFDFDIMCAAQR